MKSYHFIIIIVCATILNGCKNECSKEKSSRKSLHISPIDLYQTYPDIGQYLPDTNIGVLNNGMQLKIGEMQMRLDSILNKRRINDSSDYNVMLERNAKLLFLDYADVLRYKYKMAEKGRGNIATLLSFSPSDRLITAEKYLMLFRSFPVEKQMDESGKKVRAKLEYYQFGKNTNKSLKIFTTSLFGNNPNKKSKYYLLVMGASWCQPCKADERSLKYWFPKIDTSLVSIIGLSLDTKKDRWESYCQKENFPWRTFIVPQSFENATIKSLEIKYIPMVFLLDSNYNIVMQHVDYRKCLSRIKDLNFSSSY